MLNVIPSTCELWKGALSEYWAAWSQPARSQEVWKDVVQTLSSVAQQRRELAALHIRYSECAAVLANTVSPATSYFCFLKECLSAIAKGRRAHSEPEG